MNNNYSVSLSDLVVALKLSGEPVDSTFLQDTRRLERALWEMGLDVNHSYSERVCSHRNLQGEVANCPRYEGSERTDESWLKSGHASLENSKFSDMADALKQFRTSSTSSEYHLRR